MLAAAATRIAVESTAAAAGVRVIASELRKGVVLGKGEQPKEGGECSWARFGAMVVLMRFAGTAYA